MVEIIHWVTEQIQHNPMFAGGAGISIMGGLAYWLRSIPEFILNIIKRYTSVSATFYSDQEVFDDFLRWMSGRIDSNFVRQVQILDGSKNDWTTTVGPGENSFFWKGRYFHIQYDPGTRNVDGTKPLKTMTIKTFGFTKKVLESILNEARKHIEAVASENIPVYGNQAWEWNHLADKKSRSSSTLYLPSGMFEDLTSDIDKYLRCADEYERVGTPYRRGYLFHGLPGTGKSSLGFVLASKYKKPLFILNLSSVTNDNELFCLITKVPNNCILMIEDIDACKIRLTREIDYDAKGVSLSALLNCLDGIVAKEGRILIITTNHINQLDSALLRPGRIDRRFEFYHADRDQAFRIIQRFFPDEIIVESSLSDYFCDRTLAEIQQLCQCEPSGQNVIDKLSEKVLDKLHVVN